MDATFNASDMKEWRMAQYYFFIELVKHDLHLSRTDVMEVMEIVRRVGLKELHRNASMEQIILSLCLYVKEKNGVKIPIERYKLMNEYNVTYKLYSRVLLNLLRFQVRRMPLVRVVKWTENTTYSSAK